MFEPNDERLCLNAKGSAGANMHLEFWHEALVDGAPEDTYFVRCDDPDTLTQDDTDNGNVICDVGFAPL